MIREANTKEERSEKEGLQVLEETKSLLNKVYRFSGEEFVLEDVLYMLNLNVITSFCCCHTCGVTIVG